MEERDWPAIADNLIVVPGINRTRLLWRCGHVGKAWTDFTVGRGESPLPLIGQLSGLIRGLATVQGVTLPWQEDDFVSVALGQPVGNWLAGGDDERVIQIFRDQWRLLPYGEKLISFVKPVKMARKEKVAITKSCAEVAMAWNSEKSQNDKDWLWEALCEKWGDVPPAADLLELLIWPAHWWLDKGPDKAFLSTEDRVSFWPTSLATEITS